MVLQSFIKKIWNILKVDIIRVFQDFFKNDTSNVRLNETYIVSSWRFVVH